MELSDLVAAPLRELVYVGIDLYAPLPWDVKIKAILGKATGHGVLQAGDHIPGGEVIIPKGTVVAESLGSSSRGDLFIGHQYVPDTGNVGGWYEIVINGRLRLTKQEEATHA